MSSYFDDNRGDSEDADNEDMMNSIEFEAESDSDELIERGDSEDFDDDDNSKNYFKFKVLNEK
jgi:hypothetical protein